MEKLSCLYFLPPFQRPVEGIRDRLYGFVLYSPKHLKGDQMGQPKTDMALDISFGSSGYALVLARAFKKVSSVLYGKE